MDKFLESVENMRIYWSIGLYTKALAILYFLLTAASCRTIHPDKHLRIGFSQCCKAPWRTVMEDEMKREMAFYPDAELIIKVAEDNSGTQVEQIKELVASEIDILMVAPYESEPLTEIVEDVYRSGIPVILIDRETDSDQYTTYVGADNYQIGKTACHYIAHKLNGKGHILEIQGSMASSFARFRSSGFLAAMNSYPGLNMVASVDGKADHQTIADLFLNHPEINIVYAHSDLLAERVYKIIREQNVNSVFILGIDGLAGKNGGIQLVEDGILNATLLYPTGGTESIQLAMAINNNLPLNKRNILQSAVIDGENARIVNFQMEKVLSLQKGISRQLELKAEIQNTYLDQKIFVFILIGSLLLAFAFGLILLRALRVKKRINKNLELKNEEIINHEQQLVALTQQVNRANQAQADFFINISHEFKTPLTLILGFADDLLPSPKLKKEIYQDIILIKENAKRLLRLVNQLMDFRKIENEGMKIRVTENDMVGFVKSVLKSYLPVAHKRKINLDLYCRHESMMVWFDTDMLDKVLFNLLSNAFKFTRDNGQISLYISKDEIEDTVKLKVEDNGVGMNQETMSHIFNPFFQSENNLKPGTGLGLPLSQRLVKLHHGEIAVSSILGKGSRFSVNLPVGAWNFKEDELDHSTKNIFVLEEDSTAHQEMAMPDEGVRTVHHELSLLIIEDHVEIQSFLQKKLEGEYTIEQAFDGVTGMQKAYELIPDIIISDVILPGMDGLMLTKTLKNDIRTSHIPIILMTAHDSQDQQIAGLKSGADDYFTKPFSFILMREKIKTLLYNRQILKENFRKDILHFKEKEHDSSDDAQFLTQFVTYIENNYSRENLSIQDLCMEFQLSRSQLYRKVKTLKGIGISEYIQEVRMKKSEELLLNEGLTVSEIAYRVGYSSPAYFTTVFRTIHGEVPLTFRNNQNFRLSH